MPSEASEMLYFVLFVVNVCSFFIPSASSDGHLVGTLVTLGAHKDGKVSAWFTPERRTAVKWTVARQGKGLQVRNQCGGT